MKIKKSKSHQNIKGLKIKKDAVNSVFSSDSENEKINDDDKLY